MPKEFSKIQQKIIDKRGKSVVVSASAGSGKTTVLVERLARMITDDRIPIDNILAITFTNDAAAEMKSRLKTALLDYQKEHGEDEWLLNQIAMLETANISTIHSFCSSLLQKYYYLLDIPLAMSHTLISSSQQLDASNNAFDKAIKELDEKDYIDLQLYLQALGVKDDALKDFILSVSDIADTKPDSEKWIRELAEENPNVEKWHKHYFDTTTTAMIEILDYLIELTEDSNAKQATKNKQLQNLQIRKDGLEKCMAAKTYAEYVAAFKEYLANMKTLPKKYNGVDVPEAKDFEAYEKAIKKVLYDDEVIEEDEKRLLTIKKAISILTLAFRRAYQQEKRNLEVIDYNDMEHFALQLLKNDWVKNEISNQFRQIMVDEFQDTNYLQEEIITSIGKDDNVFRVGDPKQSIYMFRQAKPKIMKDYLEGKDPNVEVMYMGENYRSKESLVDFNNKFYNELMNHPLLPKQFTKEDAAKCGLASQKEGRQYPVEFIYTAYDEWLNKEKETFDPAAHEGDGKRHIVHPKTTALQARSMHNENKADIIANDILKKMKEDDTLDFRSFCILTRTHTQHEKIKEALEAYGIPVMAEINSGFFVNQAVQIALAALQILDNPNNDIAMTAFLCSPLGNLSHEKLAELVIERDGSIYNKLKTVENGQYLKDYQAILDWKNLPLPELLKNIYNYKNFYYDYTDGQDKTNLDSLLEMAAGFDKDTTLKEFIDYVDKEAKLNKISQASLYGKEANVVKIKTIHHAKGLQYPVVYLYSSSTPPKGDISQKLFVDSDLGLCLKAAAPNNHVLRTSKDEVAFKEKQLFERLEEEMRLLYVATTRAEDRLVIVDTVKNGEPDVSANLNNMLLQDEYFTSYFFNYLYPRIKDCDSLIDFEKLDFLYQRPELKKKSQPFTLRKYMGPVTTISSSTASDQKLKKKTASIAQNIAKKKISLLSSSATDRGTLFHEIAGQIPYPYTKDNIEVFAKKKGLHLTNDDIAQIMALNENETYGNWMKMKHQFELPYLQKQDSRLYHGFMDLVVEDGDTIHILDFKTDRGKTMKELENLYQPQLKIYEDAMKEIYPDKKVKTYLYSFTLNDLHELT